MTNVINRSRAVFMVLALAVLTGCASIGGGDSALMDDVLTERSVIRALYDEPELTGDAISVGCVDGIVTLSGFVETEVDRQLAERITRGIAGVNRVNNNLKTQS